MYGPRSELSTVWVHGNSFPILISPSEGDERTIISILSLARFLPRKVIGQTKLSGKF